MKETRVKTIVALSLCMILPVLAGCPASSGNSSASNNPPTIFGSPPTEVLVGHNYSYLPTASDPDGDILIFSIRNKPAWANFDPSTGILSGFATLGTEGKYADIQISVSDGSLSVSNNKFSIEVIQIASGSVTLSWIPPSQNIDGSPLTDLAAYRIYYGNSSGTYPNEIYVGNPGISNYVVENLVPDTYYFASTSINASGFESDFSNEAVKQIF